MAKKYSRNKDRPSSKVYKAERRDLKNKVLKGIKHLKKHPNDLQSAETPKAAVSYIRKHNATRK